MKAESLYILNKTFVPCRPAPTISTKCWEMIADHLSKAGRSWGRVSDTALSNRREALEIKNAANVLCEINFNESRLEFYNSLCRTKVQ
jgi:hypothetical protein